MSNNPANDPKYIYDLMERMEEDPLVSDMVHNLFRRGDLKFLLHDAQLKIRNSVYSSNEKEILVLCSRQFGKSFLILCVAIEYCVQNPGTIVRIFSNTETQVLDIINDNLRIIEQLAPPGFINRKKSDKRWFIGGTGTNSDDPSKLSQIRIGPLARAHVDGKRGGNASLIILEEGGFTNSEDYKSAIGSVIGPQLLRSRGKLVHVTTASEDPDHYVHSIVAPKCAVNNSLYNFTIYDNPQLTPDQIEEAKNRCVSEEQWRREYMCEVVRSTTSTIVPEFIPDIIKEFELPKYAHYGVSIDFGGTVDKHALLLYYYDFEQAKIRFFNERFLPKNSSTQEIIDAALSMEATIQQSNITSLSRIADAPGQVRVDLSRLNFSVRMPDKGPGSLEAGINNLRLLVGNLQVEIHPRCKHLIAVLTYGRYTENRKDFVRTETLGHCDMLMAAVYAVRHINKSNPFPQNYGVSKHSHYIRDNTAKNVIKDILTGGF